MTKPILYFIAGNVPTNEEFEKAAVLMNKGPLVEFVSLQTLDLNGPKLAYSEVHGEVPDLYKEVSDIRDLNMPSEEKAASKKSK